MERDLDQNISFIINYKNNLYAVLIRSLLLYIFKFLKFIKVKEYICYLF